MEQASGTERFQHFVLEIKESFEGKVYDKGEQAVKKLLEVDSERKRQPSLMTEAYEHTGIP